MRKYICFLISLLLLVTLLCSCSTAAEKKPIDAISKATMQPTTTSTPISTPCPVRIAKAFYAYIYDSANGETGMDNLYLQIESNWKNKIISTVDINVEAYDKYGNQIVKGNQKSTNILHEEAIDYGQYSKNFIYKLSGFTGVTTYRIRVKGVTTADGEEWVATDNNDYLNVIWNGRVSGQVDKSIKNEYIDKAQKEIISNLNVEGFNYSSVDPLMYFGSAHILLGDISFLLQYDNFEVEFSGDSIEGNPNRGVAVDIYLNEKENKDQIIKIAEAVLPAISNITKEEAVNIIEEGLDLKNIASDNYDIKMSVPISSELLMGMAAPESGIELRIEPKS